MSPAEEPPDEPVPWEQNEPGFRETVAELGRLFERARRRPKLVMALTIIVATLMVLRSARKEISYGATVKLLVSENEQEASSREVRSGSRIYSNDKLRDFIINAAFTDGRVLQVLKDNDFRVRDVENNPRLVLQSFREDVEVDVYRNHFVQEPMGVARTANIAIGFRVTDPEKALAIVRSLGDLVVERDSAYRKEAYAAARSMSSYELRLIEERMREVEGERVNAKTRADFAATRGAKGELVYRADQLGQKLLALEYERTAARSRFEELRMMDNAGAMGLRFERIDWGAPETVVNKKMAVARFGLIVLLLCFPFVAMAVGGFDRRVYDSGDVRRLGLKVLGTVRAPRAPSQTTSS